MGVGLHTPSIGLLLWVCYYGILHRLSEHTIMISKTFEIISATVLFCCGISIVAWLVNVFGNFVAVKLKIRDKE
jgi:hypothetical protein